MFGERLKRERQRLGMNQEDFAAVGGVKKRAQISYEKDERSPDAAYLCALLDIGVDIWYVMTGTISVGVLTLEESEIVAGYRSLDTRGKAGVLGMMDGFRLPAIATSATSPAAHVEIHGKVGNSVVGNITGRHTFNLGSTGRKKEK